MFYSKIIFNIYFLGIKILSILNPSLAMLVAITAKATRKSLVNVENIRHA